MTLVIAANYGGRWDIACAARKLAQRVAAGEIAPDDVTVENISSVISLADLPEPDLFIRTGGEQRISNFPDVAARLHRTLFHSTTLARLRRTGICRSAD